MPKISVIIPVYNTEKYLPKCLDSVVNQTLNDIEIICINDCSTDGSLTVLQEYAKKDKRIKLIDLPENSGAGEAKNKGLQIAKGEYLGFVDPDDYIDLNFYEELYKKAVETNADIVKTQLLTVEIQGLIKKSHLNGFIKSRSKFYFSYEYTSAIYKSNIIFDNKIIFPPELIVGEDVVFLHEAILKAKTVEVINSTNYYYIRRLNSLNTHMYDKKRMLSAIKTIEYMAKHCEDSCGSDISHNEYLNQYFECILPLIDHIIIMSDEKELKYKCVEKFIELFNECKYVNELEDICLKKYPLIEDLIKNSKSEELFNILIKYKNLRNYSMLTALRQNVKKDLQNAKSISNNTCL